MVAIPLRLGAFSPGSLSSGRNQQKVSISAVARKVGVTPALIHNTYPDVADRIRTLTGRQPETKAERDGDSLRALQAANKRLQQDNAELNADVARLASIVQILPDEIARLRAVTAGKAVELVKAPVRCESPDAPAGAAPHPASGKSAPGPACFALVRIGEFLKELEMTEGRSTGIPKILKEMAANGSPAPLFETDDDRLSFVIRQPRHPLALVPTVGGSEATGEVERLLRVVVGEMSRQQIQSALRLRSEEHFRTA